MPALPISTAPMPERLGPYRLVRELGRGGTSRVYEAVHDTLKKRVAIKAQHRPLPDDSVALRRFLREGRASCRVSHPHVAEVHSLGTDGGLLYMVMDLLEGVDLGKRVRTDGPIGPSELATLMLPICSAVAAAHEAGIIHRDLKPSNLMLSRDGRGQVVPVVLDFGASKLDLDDDEAQLTVSGAILGTVHYMSPEQLRSPKDADAKSDQYSLGAILYECSTGRRPFEAASYYELMEAIMTAPLPVPSTLVASLPSAFDEVVARAMSRKPADRFPSVNALASALLPFADDAVAGRWRAELAAGAAGPQAPSEQAAGGDARSEVSVVSAGSIGSTLPDRAESGSAVAWSGRKIAIGLAVALAVSAAIAVAIMREPAAREASARTQTRTPTAARAVLHPVSVTNAGSARQAVQLLEQSPEHARAAAAAAAPAPSSAVASPPARAKPKPRKPPSRPASAPIPLGDNGAPILE